MDKAILLEQLRFEEGVWLRVYQDTKGIDTIGIGHNLESSPYFAGKLIPHSISEGFADAICLHDIDRTAEQLAARLAMFGRLDAPRQEALVNMAFQLGVDGLLEFHQTLRAVALGEWDKVKALALGSKWATECSSRANRVVGQLVSGVRYVVPVVKAV